MEGLNQQSVKKKKKPDFIVKEAKFSSGVKKRWRYPRGRHSAVRQRHKGRPAIPHPGYGSSNAIRGKHPSGFGMVLVHNQKELLSVNPTDQGAIIASAVGRKTRLGLLKLASERMIKILNLKCKDIQEEIKNIQSGFEERKKIKTETLNKKSKKKEEKKKEAEEKKKKEEEKKTKKEQEPEEKPEELEKKKEEQREMEKIITRRQ